MSLCVEKWKGEGQAAVQRSAQLLCKLSVRVVTSLFFPLFFLGKPCPAAKAKQTAALATTEQRQAEAAERFKLRVSEGTKS